jgi:pimeloyl-ACP methyl ester carboxylesterase
MAAVEVAYEVTGEGPPLYLVHGIGSRKATWGGVIPQLEDRFTCVTHDLRGHGQSPVPPTPYTLDDLVADLEALRARLGHEKIHVMGHSLGGMIAPAYARAHPGRALSAGLLSTAAGRTEEDRARLKAVGEAMERKGIGPVLDTLVARWYTDAFIAARPEAIEARKKQVTDTPAQVFLSVFWIYATTEMGPWLPEVACPCLVLTGELDAACSPRS